MTYNGQLPILKEPRKDGFYGIVRNEDIYSIEDSEPHAVTVRAWHLCKIRGQFCMYPVQAKCWIEWWGA